MHERRKHKRYFVHEDVYVYRMKRIGRVMNISHGGMLCQCAHQDECSPVDFDVFCPGSSISLVGLPFSIIKARAAKESRQCHISFGTLPPEKLDDLTRFIDSYSVAG